jgi:AraC-like DNA-binding protein
VDEALVASKEIYGDHRIELLGPSDSFNFRLCNAPLPKTAVTYKSYGVETFADPEEPKTFFGLHLALTGVTECHVGGEVCEVTPGEGMVTSPTQPVPARWGASSGQVMVKIERYVLEEHLSALTGAPVATPVVFEPRVHPGSGFGGRYKRLLEFLVTELDADDTLTDAPLLAGQMEETLMTALLVGQPHNHSMRFERQQPPAAPLLVRRVEEYIFENAAKPIMMSDLVRLSDISGRSLFRAFKEYRGYSPMAFLLATRLQRVRETLLAGDANTTVTDAALDWGFSHLSRFSAEYAKRFGENPSETLRKARGLR